MADTHTHTPYLLPLLFLFIASGAMVFVGGLINNNSIPTSQKSLPFAPNPPSKISTPVYQYTAPLQTTPRPTAQPASSKVPVYQPSVRFQMGEIQMKANSVVFRDTVGVGAFEKKAPTGSVYVVLNLQMLNVGRSSTEVRRGSFKLLDSVNRSYDVTTDIIHSGADITLLSYSETIQPGIPWNGYLVFRVPSSVKNSDTTLAVTMGTTTKLVHFKAS